MAYFAARYFAPRYFAPRYFAGGESGPERPEVAMLATISISPSLLATTRLAAALSDATGCDAILLATVEQTVALFATIRIEPR